MTARARDGTTHHLTVKRVGSNYVTQVDDTVSAHVTKYNSFGDWLENELPWAVTPIVKDHIAHD